MYNSEGSVKTVSFKVQITDVLISSIARKQMYTEHGVKVMQPKELHTLETI